MSGSTRIAPEDLGVFDTRFNAGYVLAALDLGAWQPVARVDLFQTFQRYNGERGFLAEHGHATTLALNWRPHERVRVTGECLRIDSARNQRRAQGAPPRQAGIQWQLALRWFY